MRGLTAKFSVSALLLFVAAQLAPPQALAIQPPGKLLLGGDGTTGEELDKAYRESYKEEFPVSLKRAGPNALPDIFGPGSVLKAGNVVMKVTNIGICGNPFVTSSDPSGQWPGASGVEYMNAIALAVGGVETVNGQQIRRVTYSTEWRPPSLDVEDKIYAAYDGIIGGNRFSDDDGDGRIDEDFLDGRDNDGDGKIDEDYGALGQQEYSCVMTDFSLQSLTSNVREQHVPLGLRVEQTAWAYSLTSPNLTNFNAIEYNVINVSGNEIDSLYIGWLVDFDAGPVTLSNYFQDDQDIPWYPQGWFIYDWTQGGQVADTRVQKPHDPSIPDVSADSPLCQRDTIWINGFSIADDNGDDSKTTGVPSFLLFEHSIDPLGIDGPSRVGWRAFRSYTGGTPYNQSGAPTIDQQRYELISGLAIGGQCCENIQQNRDEPNFGLITAPQGDQKGDYVAWGSVGPWRHVANNQSVHATVGMAVAPGTFQLGNAYANSYQPYLNADDSQRGALGKQILDAYPSVNNAFTAQLAYEGVWERNIKFPDRPTFHGRETALKAPRGGPYDYISEDCGDRSQVNVQLNDREFFWFDFDCSYCTGVWDYIIGNANPLNRGAGGMVHKTWNASSPPPSPVMNAAITYNFSENPNRNFIPGQDNKIVIAWNNLSEGTPDPAPPNLFDFRGYKIWKVSDWVRPVGSPGPAEEDWSLLAEFRFFDYLNSNGSVVQDNLIKVQDPANPTQVLFRRCPKVYVPSRGDSVEMCLKQGDLWNKQTGEVIHPDTTVHCVLDAKGNCLADTACIMPPSQGDCRPPWNKIGRIRYPVGRYHYVDTNVKNGFIYFYSVTAFDSTDVGQSESRRSAVEAEGVVPQIATRKGKSVWVVPNPYRGYAAIQQRPSSWDLTPNATDPTGTHIDFFGMPPGPWTIRIFTISGDLVQTIHSTDPTNDSVRGTITQNGQPFNGSNLQQDNPNDGQARWNLISRNGQDVVSGIYLFTVESGEGTQRGKFVVIR